VALGTFALLWTAFELARMDVLVTILAIFESKGLFKIPADVTGNAGNLRVGAKQGKFRFRMIEFELGGNFLPSRGGVAVLAFLLEGAVVRVVVAGGASSKLHVLKARGTAGDVRLVARFAFNFLVHAGERVTCF